MTLATILFFAIFWTAAAPPLAPSQAQPQSAPADTSAKAPETQDQQPAQSQTPPADAKPTSPTAAPSKAAAAQPKPAAKRIHHKKRVSSPCSVSAAPAAGSTASNSDPPSTKPADAPSDAGAQQAPATPPSATPAAPKPCAPPKIIVRRGGTSEPSIQLAGGPGDTEAAHKRNVVNQLLGVTEGNLKRIAGLQLSTTQQDTVSQIRQFMDQSKAALAEGNVERARTLAWKAELLSEDLVKAPK